LGKRKRKIFGACLAFIGVFVTRLEHFIHLQPTLRFPLYLFGVLISLAGLAVFASGLGKRDSI
jgi:drug/metabolite transporter (DMT)-like permease